MRTDAPRSMTRLHTAMLAATMFLLATQGCTPVSQESDSSSVPAPLAIQNAPLNSGDSPGALLGVYRAYWPKRGDAELADRVTKLATVLGGTSARLIAPEKLRELDSRPFDDQKFQVSYKEQFDDLVIRVPSRLPDALPDTDIGEGAARSIAGQAIEALYSSGLVTKGQYSLTDFGTGHRKRGEYAGDGSPVKNYVVEYRFRSLRKLNGIDVANNGIVIGVTPSGELSSIRVGGAQIDSVNDGGEEKPTAAGRIFVRAVDTAAVERRFQSEVAPDGKKTVFWKTPMYVVPRHAPESLIEPVIAYRYAQTFDAVIEPFHTIGYSLEDASVAYRDLDAE